MNSNNKICVNCKFSSGTDAEFLKCSHPKNFIKNRVTGGQIRNFTYCDTHRIDSPFLLSIFMGLCGNRGRWFEPKIK